MSRKPILNVVKLLAISVLISAGVVALSSFSNTADDFLLELQQKYNRFTGKYPVVKINMAFNQPAYAPGDTVFLKAWYQTESRSAVKGTHIITVDIISGEGKTIQKTRFKVTDGIGHNQIILPDNFPIGLFKVVGYSDWMKNFGESWYYTNDLLVTRNKDILVTYKEPDSKLQFFVEGGKAIAGVLNKFVAVGASASHFIVLDKSDKPAIEFDMDSAGIGIFEFIPEVNNSYHIVWKDKNWALPALESDGLNLRLADNRQAVQLTLPHNSKWMEEELYAVGLTNGEIILKRKFSVSRERSFDLSLVKEARANAYNQLFIFNKNGEVLASRIFLFAEEQQVSLKINFPEKLDQRAETSGTISITDSDGNGLESNLTVSVFQQDLFALNSTNVFYRSELPDVDKHVKKNPGMATNRINDFLITQNWSRLNWETILAEKDMKIDFPFSSQFGLKGQVLAKEGVSEIPDSTMIIAYLQENTIGYEGYSKNGKFVIPFVLDFFGKDQVFFTLQNKSKVLDDEYDIRIQNDSVKLSGRWASRESEASSLYGNYAMKRAIVSRSYSFFETKSGLEEVSIENPNRFFEDEFLGVDFSVNVSEYVIFPTMIELVREVVPFVQYRKKKSGDELRLSYRRENTTHVFQSDPLYIMDGAMTRNTQFFLSLKPEDLLYLKIINNPNKLSQLGKLGENGVIFIESKKGDLAAKILTKNYFEATGISRTIDFPIKSRERAKVSRPDLRSTLYWNPALKTDQSGMAKVIFSASDDLGPMKIVVQGITKDGIPFTGEKVIRVEFNNQVK